MSSHAPLSHHCHSLREIPWDSVEFGVNSVRGKGMETENEWKDSTRSILVSRAFSEMRRNNKENKEDKGNMGRNKHDKTTSK